MAQAAPKLLTYDEFISLYGDNERYELIDGELVDMEPTGPHEQVAPQLAYPFTENRSHAPGRFFTHNWHTSSLKTDRTPLADSLPTTGIPLH